VRVGPAHPLPSPPPMPTCRGEEALEARAQEKYEKAREDLEKARELFEKDQNWEGYVRAQNGVGAMVLRQGDYEAALEQLNLAMATAREKLGPSHREIARSYQEIGNLYVMTRRPAEGLEALGKAHSLREKQFALKREYEALRQRLEKEYPDYYDLKYRFETVGPAELRERALDERTVLVEYFLGRERVFIFTITREGLEVTGVPRDASLEAELGELRQAILARDLASHARSAHRLYRLLLSPVEGRLAARDLVIVPDGPLSTLPFEALLKREVSPNPVNGRELPYVLRDHAVSYAYSATVLLQGLRHKKDDPPDAFVAFAPLFAEANASADAPRPLPASRKEVTDVLGLFGKRAGFFGGWLSGRSRVYVGRDATEGRVKSGGLERYRYVHLATHGIVDEQHPGLSRLLLMPEKGSGDDGVLHLGEIYNLRLNADLVVLSGCDTGRGRIARGEGIIGLTRGFLYAGAQSLLVSLWPVSDAASSGLVVDFYAELLGGRPKAQALREAKLRTMGRNPEYAKPYYWSSLVLVGQSR